MKCAQNNTEKNFKLKIIDYRNQVTFTEYL